MSHSTSKATQNQGFVPLGWVQLTDREDMKSFYLSPQHVWAIKSMQDGIGEYSQLNVGGVVVRVVEDADTVANLIRSEL